MESVSLVAPVTALLLEKGCAVAGVGPFLQSYRIDGACKRPETSLQIFRASKIHGIKSKGDGLLCVYGSKSCRIVRLDQDNSFSLVTAEREFADWIWDVAWLQDDQRRWSVALALGHNSVMNWDHETDTVLHHVECQEKCILYSALFLGSTWESLVLAAGTVFNQVVLWGVNGVRDETGRLEVMHRLHGHKGVIFSMAYHAQRQVFCSVSDDRSMQLWQVAWPEASASSSADWATANFTLLHVLYGHTSRVWGVRLGQQSLVSIGEDATCIIWNYDGEVLKKLKGHKGKGIWSLDVDEEHGLIVTGGGDGGILLWNLGDQSSTASEVTSRSLPPPHEETSGGDFFPRTIKLFDANTLLVMSDAGTLFTHNILGGTWNTVFADEAFKSYSVIETCPKVKAVAVGNIHGDVHIICNDVQQRISVYAGKVFSLCWLTETASDSISLLTTGPRGHMILWHVHFSAEGITMDKSGEFVLPVSKQHWVSCADLITASSLMICGDRVGSVHLYDLQRQGEPIQSFWKIHGKAGVTDICCHGNSVYTCGRDGQYRQFVVNDEQLELLHSNRVIKGFEWLSKLHFEGEDLLVLGFHTNEFVVYSTGTQQRLVTVCCGGGHRAWDFMLEGNGDQAMFAYIKSREVVLCNASVKQTGTVLKPGLHGRDIMELKYLWTQVTDEEGKDALHRDTLHKSLSDFIHVMDARPNMIPSMDRYVCHRNGTCHICASGSEDTQVNLLGIKELGTSRSCEVECLTSISSHISSIRTLSTSKCYSGGRSQSHLVFSGGGRSQVKCARVFTNQETSDHSNVSPTVGSSSSQSGASLQTLEDSNQSGSPVQNELESSSKLTTYQGNNRPEKDYNKEGCDIPCDAKLLNHLDVQYEHCGGHMLHSKGKWKRKPWKLHDFNSDPETRFMDLTSLCAMDLTGRVEHAQLHLLLCACSDAFIRIFCFNESNKSFDLVCHSSSQTHCMLKISYAILSARLVAMAAGTEGCVAFWDITDIIQAYLCHIDSAEGRTLNIQSVNLKEHKQTADQANFSGTKFEGDDDDEYMSLSELEGVLAKDLPYNIPNTMKDEGAVGIDSSLDDFDKNKAAVGIDVTASAHNEGENLLDMAEDMAGASSEGWRSRPLMLQQLTLISHQSGVNALSWIHDDEDHLIIVTGGDDNALCIFKVHHELSHSKTALSLVRSLRVDSAHAAQITGACLLDSSSLATISIDQRLTLWSLDWEEQQVVQEACKFVHVSDVANLEVWKWRGVVYVAVCGMGLEIVKLPGDSTRRLLTH